MRSRSRPTGGSPTRVSENIGLHMTKLGADDEAELRAYITRELAVQEERRVPWRCRQPSW